MKRPKVGSREWKRIMEALVREREAKPARGARPCVKCGRYTRRLLDRDHGLCDDCKKKEVK